MTLDAPRLQEAAHTTQTGSPPVTNAFHHPFLAQGLRITHLVGVLYVRLALTIRVGAKRSVPDGQKDIAGAGRVVRLVRPRQHILVQAPFTGDLWRPIRPKAELTV